MNDDDGVYDGCVLSEGTIKEKDQWDGKLIRSEEIRIQPANQTAVNSHEKI